MTRTGLLVVTCALALVVGCDDTRSGDDAGTIVLMDSGPRADSGGGGVDSGGGGGGCAVTDIMPLPAACLPRCANSTAAAVNACSSQPPDMQGACIQSALGADTTPAIAISTPDPSLNMLDCELCYSWQVVTCIVESCPSEYSAVIMCDDTTTDCSSQETALDNCLMTNMAAFQACGNNRVPQCFSTTSGFLPQQPREFRMDIPRITRFLSRIDLPLP